MSPTTISIAHHALGAVNIFLSGLNAALVLTRYRIDNGHISVSGVSVVALGLAIGIWCART